MDVYKEIYKINVEEEDSNYCYIEMPLEKLMGGLFSDVTMKRCYGLGFLFSLIVCVVLLIYS
jgi:hypothetical protein